MLSVDPDDHLGYLYSAASARCFALAARCSALTARCSAQSARCSALALRPLVRYHTPPQARALRVLTSRVFPITYDDGEKQAHIALNPQRTLYVRTASCNVCGGCLNLQVKSCSRIRPCVRIMALAVILTLAAAEAAHWSRPPGATFSSTLRGGPIIPAVGCTAY